MPNCPTRWGWKAQHSFFIAPCMFKNVKRFAWWRQDLHAIELLRAHIGEWTMTQMLDYWWVMCFTGYRLNWNSWIWILFPVDSDCALLCSQVDMTRYSSIASGNNCIVQLVSVFHYTFSGLCGFIPCTHSLQLCLCWILWQQRKFYSNTRKFVIKATIL
jgi:hypothetical protein